MSEKTNDKKLSIFISITALVASCYAVFSSKNPDIPTDFFSMASLETVQKALEADPQMVFDALVALDQQNIERQKSDMAQKISSVSSDLFPDDGIKAVEFIDMNCSYCARFHAVLKEEPVDQLVQKVRFVHFPILGEESRQKAMALLLIRDKFGLKREFEAVDAFFSSSQPWNITAKDFGLSQSDIELILSSPSDLVTTLDHNIQMAQSLGITGTPSFVTKERVFSGMISEDVFQGILAE